MRSTVVIQMILLLAIAIVAVLLTRSTAGARHQAIRRLFLLGFVAVAVFSIIFPTWLSKAANALGVGRGTDLLLYGLVIAFLSYIATNHRNTKQVSRQITLLTRELTLSQARYVAEKGPVGGPDTPELSDDAGSGRAASGIAPDTHERGRSAGPDA
jgi:small membrane protein